MSSVEKLMMFFLQKSRRIIESGIGGMASILRMAILYLYIKNILNTIGAKTIFDEMWYIVEYFIVNIFYFLILFDW